jgi:L-lactate dehydrogenase complex protein LldF
MNHAERATRFIADAERAAWHDTSLWFLREKRDRAAQRVPDWEALREEASAIKGFALSRLPELWTQFEQRARARGAVVHWARDAAEHNAIVATLLVERGVRRVVKSKSMLTEECGLNPHLEALGIEVVDTDLGERIVQLRDEPPSHIVMPAIHLRRGEIGELFAREMGTPAGLDDPAALTAAARRDLRTRFLAAEAALTGVNFAVAESGGLVVVTNEGNADLGTALTKLHIASVGLEKIVPEVADLPVFLRLLARSATGQAITSYTSHFHGPASPDGELHVIVVDNGRTGLLGRSAQREALACIRCGACMNTCPVYRRSGGHSYGATVPGPIGSVLEPARDPGRHASLPHACTLCGSCADVCPVKIPLPKQLLAWRGELHDHRPGGATVSIALRLAAAVMANAALYDAVGRIARFVGRNLPPRMLAACLGPWTRGRTAPVIPARSFRQQLAERERERG